MSNALRRAPARVRALPLTPPPCDHHGAEWRRWARKRRVVHARDCATCGQSLRVTYPDRWRGRRDA